ncbi:MAG: hypothetical protein C6P37_06580 [Caldibacillus debilis]|uniref:Uncharacterized protein n=1 Tax=Caldibacillus debilis TaxID=301148 RepID=A0A3E0K4X0_9BACI|nr:MAG: hypothetical protein C6P37_06580 [Caldibacillus debilis]
MPGMAKAGTEGFPFGGTIGPPGRCRHVVFSARGAVRKSRGKGFYPTGTREAGSVALPPG